MIFWWVKQPPQNESTDSRRLEVGKLITQDFMKKREKKRILNLGLGFQSSVLKEGQGFKEAFSTRVDVSM